jgi:hypothetical protein
MEHQIFVEFFGWFEDKENVFLAMEYFPLGTLDNFINDKLYEDDTRKISLQLLEGLHIMHEESFTHRDLKPQVSICSCALLIHGIMYLTSESEYICRASVSKLVGEDWRFWHHKACLERRHGITHCYRDPSLYGPRSSLLRR